MRGRSLPVIRGLAKSPTILSTRFCCEHGKLEPRCGWTGRDLHLHLYALLTEWHRERLAAGRMGGKAHMENENFSRGRAACRREFAVSGFASRQIRCCALSPRARREGGLAACRAGRVQLCASCANPENFANRSRHAFGMRARRAERNSGTQNSVVSGEDAPLLSARGKMRASCADTVPL